MLCHHCLCVPERVLVGFLHPIKPLVTGLGTRRSPWKVVVCGFSMRVCPKFRGWSSFPSFKKLSLWRVYPEHWPSQQLSESANTRKREQLLWANPWQRPGLFFVPGIDIGLVYSAGMTELMTFSCRWSLLLVPMQWQVLYCHAIMLLQPNPTPFMTKGIPPEINLRKWWAGLLQVPSLSFLISWRSGLKQSCTISQDIYN